MVLFQPVDKFLQDSDLYTSLSLPSHTTQAYFEAVETHYRDVPYHNIHHVTGVVELAARIWLTMGLGETVARIAPTDHDVLALAFITAAATHDLEHCGLTNDYLVRTHHPFAIMYNDVSPNESHHASTAFRILFNEHNFIEHFAPETVRLVRSTVIHLIISTDMSNHFSIVTSIRSRDMANPSIGDLTVLLQAALKCADLGHAFMDTTGHVSWSGYLQKEMFQEGAHWKSHGWQVPALMDRESAEDFPSSQLGFFNYVIIPFVESLQTAIPDVKALLAQAKVNAKFWQSQRAMAAGNKSESK